MDSAISPDEESALKEIVRAAIRSLEAHSNELNRSTSALGDDVGRARLY